MSAKPRCAVLCLAVATLISAASAQVSLTSVSSATLQLSGKSYYQVTATMNGPPAFPYRVPILLLYPVNPSQSNGATVVDFLNNTAMRLRGADTGFAEFQPPTPCARIFLGDDFLGAHGYSYVAIQWDREMIPIINLHQGTSYVIPTDADQIRIAFDVGDLLHQQPAGLPGTLGASKRIAFAYSATASFLQTIVEHPVLKAGLSLRFEGVLLGSVGRLSGPSTSPQGLPAGLGGSQSGADLKTMIVNTETDVQYLDAHTLRGESASYRSYEIAGAAHNPMSLVPMAQFLGLAGMSASERQNPLDPAPVFRAMVAHLRSWTLGTATPPPSVGLGTPFNAGNIDLTPVYSGAEHFMDVPRSASTGNVLGGIRLPHIVAPIGFHNGVETSTTMAYSATALGQIISGKFAAYGAADLAARYPTHLAYVQAITNAADAALAAGWILAADRNAYVATAQASAIGTGVALTPAQILDCFQL
jgi:Alpha/beta hydrolase domain